MRITATYHRHAQTDGQRPAIVTEEETLSYQNWAELVNQTAASFRKEQAVHRRVALFLPNGRLFLQLFAGAAAAGWAAIVGDMRWTAEEMKARLNEVAPDLVIADDGMKPFFEASGMPVIFASEVKDWLSEEEEEAKDEENVPFYIGFTSGSTGKPKAFVRSHDSWVESFQCNKVELSMTEKEHVLIPGSFVNSTFLYGALSTLFLGGTLYVLKKFSPDRFMHYFQHYPITAVYVVPTMLHALLKEGCSSDRAVSFISTGAKWQPQVKKDMHRHFPKARFYEFYGSSELSFVTVLQNEQQTERPDSVGKAFHNVEVKVVDEKGREVGAGEAGTLYVKSNMLFDGYLNNEEETNKVLQGEWATVHDIAKMDEDGYVYILGRKNDMILYGGINIYPQEIEKVLREFPGVEEAVVVGVKDEYWGEKVAACVKGNVSLHQLKQFCRSNLSPYKVPRLFRQVDSFPYTTGGKISRRVVKKQLEQEVSV